MPVDELEPRRQAQFMRSQRQLEKRCIRGECLCPVARGVLLSDLWEGDGPFSTDEAVNRLRGFGITDPA